MSKGKKNIYTMKTWPIKFMRRTNTKGSILVMALHWKWSITWRWSIIYSLPTSLSLKFHVSWWRGPGATKLVITTPLGQLLFSTQPNLRRGWAENTAHKGDPCIYCGTPHDDVEIGPCPARRDYE